MADYYPSGEPAPIALTAAGTNQATSAALTPNVLHYSTGAASVGVRLPVSAAGTKVRVYNLHASTGLQVFPHSGGDINDGSTDAAVTIEGKTLAIFENLDGTTWVAIYTANT